jgi:hypothetical protein
MRTVPFDTLAGIEVRCQCRTGSIFSAEFPTSSSRIVTGSLGRLEMGRYPKDGHRAHPYSMRREVV